MRQRLKRVRVSTHYLEQILRGQIAGVSSNVPSDLAVRAIVHQIDPRVFEFLCESEEFDEVPEADVIPEFEAIYTTEPIP